jgi:hypothetical protein
MEFIFRNISPMRPVSGFTATGNANVSVNRFTTSENGILAEMKIVLGIQSAGSWAYISFLLSPTKPPNVREGLEAVKNQKDRARRQYHNQAGSSGMYLMSQCQCSQCHNRKAISLK